MLNVLKKTSSSLNHYFSLTRKINGHLVEFNIIASYDVIRVESYHLTKTMRSIRDIFTVNEVIACVKIDSDTSKYTPSFNCPYTKITNEKDKFQYKLNCNLMYSKAINDEKTPLSDVCFNVSDLINDLNIYDLKGDVSCK